MKKPLRNAILFLLSILLMLSAGFASYAEEAIFGDADGDGEVTAQDASCISRHLHRFRMMDAAALSRADFDGDGAITERDASLILSSLMSSEFSVPVTRSFSMLVTSDIAGNAWDPAAADDNSSCTAIHTASCIQKLRADDPDLLLFDAGGSIFGSSIADDYPENTERSYGPITSLFIRLAYDAVLLGEEALSYSSGTVRREVNAMHDRKLKVLGANLQKSEPTIFDPSGVLWNELEPYVICSVQQGEGEEPLRVAVIGMTDPDICASEDEIAPADPIEIYAKLRKELKDRADYTVLLYCGSADVDAQGLDSYSLRDLIKKTDSIDLVLVSHVGVSSVRSERNADGTEIPIITLSGGAQTVTQVSVSMRSDGRPAVLVHEIDASHTEPDTAIKGSMKPYVSKISAMMDAAVCTLGERFEMFDAHALSSSDAMELTHEMQLFALRNWIDYHDIDLPNDLISIAYPYIPIDGAKKGTLTYRDLYALKTETPKYSVLLIRGAELRKWLSVYAGMLMDRKTVYSLYGLSYLLNTQNPDTPLGFLEHSSGRSVEDDEIFTLILAERPEDEINIRQYLDEEWMPYEDRLIEGFELPKPYIVSTTGEDPIVDALVAFLEELKEYHLTHLYTWIII